MRQRLEELKVILKIEEKERRISEIEQEMNSPDFWSDEKAAQARARELKSLQREVKEFNDLYEIAQIASDEELEFLRSQLEELEIRTYFTGKYDNNGAILNFYSGAGGVDAQDWNEMLLQMYLRWAERNNYIVKVLAESRGEEAGIKGATIEISGSYAYGKLKGESGVHRLVRLSPYNAKNLRQTSFALVEVMPDIEAEDEIAIDPKDLRIDVFRSSGHGGQSVNTTDSAVRISHLPTGIVATCQNERSQLQNKETAMKILRSRLAQLMLEQHKDIVAEIRGQFSTPEWGNQIRSYVLHPYKLIKDHRTGYEETSPEKVLGGELEGFIEAEIKWLVKEGLNK